ncbi:hypothetical protein NG800_004395 [Epilithonimonas ginsengisoli]|uniref:Periplasmic heavy metal sensor n=1 Tax=Epilithonimonas ginsengisoli TaxID=1245592 RepID=A0ABU4JEN0_9FLAO|nr:MULTISPECIES: hypothetical protein [Chryseobacterium group]MBO6201186.1 hypothetical protein [Chryseobacterium sp.]MBV6879501.1 hypothetical protein [Epilithonimonas sp. FP105]MDW8548137.1 hypothetical protein [Epilithonimonas ginsengisoli]
MNKFLLIVLIAGFSSVHTIKGQRRNSGNTSGRTTTTSPSYRSVPSSSLLPSGSTQRQTIPRTSEWKSMNMQEKKQAVSNMSVKDRSVFLQNIKENIVIDDLDIPKEKQDEFKTLYAEYQNNQKQIKEKFHVDKNLDNLSDEDATKRLNQSFEVGQQLLNNRKTYADKFLRILTPQQVLTLFQTEGKMREKMLDKKNDK